MGDGNWANWESGKMGIGRNYRTPDGLPVKFGYPALTVPENSIPNVDRSAAVQIEPALNPFAAFTGQWKRPYTLPISLNFQPILVSCIAVVIFE
jgi:hypothetical protein